MARYTICVLLLLAAGCRPPSDVPSIAVVDLVKRFDRADKRPPGAFLIADRGRPSILAPAPGRIEWKMPLPRRGRLQTSVAADGNTAVRFRVGVSDDRIYEKLADILVEPAQGWMAVSADLSAYAGVKCSLFYRPDTIAWHVVLSTDAVNGEPGRGVWGAPQVLTDPAGAVEYERRRRPEPAAGSRFEGARFARLEP